MIHIENVVLRNEGPSDYRTVEEITREAFWNHYCPGCDEHYLLHIMREADSFIHELDIVAEVDGEIVGNIVYTKAKIVDDDGVDHCVITFGPLSVLPTFQGKGIGSQLIEYTKKKAKELGYKAILIYGDPDYYSRLGFTSAENYKIGTADNMYAVALQAIELYPGALSHIKGRFIEDKIYDIDEKASKKFDQGFPSKEKLGDRPSQKKFLEIIKMRIPR